MTGGETMLAFFSGRLRVSPFALVLLLIIAFSPDAPIFYLALVFAALHEIGHLLALHRLGARLLCLSVYPFGADMRADLSSLSYRAEILCALAGPFASLAAALLLLPILHCFKNVYILSSILSNLLFFAVNILPVRGLDGGRALLALLLSKLDYQTAYKAFDAVSTVSFGILCLGALYLVWASGYNLSLVFICIYLFMSEFVKGRRCFGE